MVIRVEGLSCGYKKKIVLANLHFELNEGEFLCVLGANGAGKTTLFKALLGLVPSIKGKVLIHGNPVETISPLSLAKTIAYIPQSHQPAFNFSVFDVMLMGRNAHISSLRSPNEHDEQKVIEVANNLGITPLLDKGYGEISGGQRQLVLIARAMVQEAKILIMDEPTANLDYGNQIRLLEKVKQLTEQGYSVIMSTHNPEHGFHYGDQGLILSDGQMIAFGPPKEILDEPMLERIYGIPIRLLDVENDHRVCIPKHRLAGKVKESQ